MEPKESRKPLRFAPLVRVSTERQAERGESLAVQTANAQKWVAELGGVIPKGCWYKGQEHATSDSERKILDQLLDDAQRGKFDAIIVNDISRWARDNLKSEQGLKILRDNDILFYVGSMEFDLHNPLHHFMLTNNVSLGALYSQMMSMRIVESKLKRCMEGRPSDGSMPFGRTWSPEEGWGVDLEKQAMIKRVARKFLAGTSLLQLERESGIHNRHLYRIFTEACGDTRTIHFRKGKTLRKAVDIVQKIPPLLDPETIRALKKRIRRGRAFLTKDRGPHNYQVLFRGLIFCGECGYGLSGLRITKNSSYYYHPRKSGKGMIQCPNGPKYVPMKVIEDKVMGDIFSTFGDVKRRQAAVHAAYAGQEQAEKVRAEIKGLQKELNRVTLEYGRIVEAVGKGLLKEEKTRERTTKLEQQEAALKSEIEKLEEQVADIPSPEEVKAAMEALAPLGKGGRRRISREVVRDQIEHSYLGSEAHFNKMTFEEKRELLRLLFGSAERVPTGCTKQGGLIRPKFTKAGIYVKKSKHGGFSYEIRGMLPDFRDGFPFTRGFIPRARDLKVSDVGFQALSFSKVGLNEQRFYLEEVRTLL